MISPFKLVCPTCRATLTEKTSCKNCGKKYVLLKKDKLISFQPPSDPFYESHYEHTWKRRAYPTLPFLSVLLSLRERISLSSRRERFFRRHLKGKSNLLILDVACGRGRKLFTEYGKVIGLDIVLEPLYETCEFYDLCVHGDAFAMPFPDEYFDYIVSADFLGHIPVERKDALYRELRRILKPEGEMLHVMETEVRWKKWTPKSDKIERRRCLNERYSTRKVYEGVSRRSGETDNGREAIIAGGSPSVVTAAIDSRELGEAI